jgi:protein-tyrosine phosphatase
VTVGTKGINMSVYRVSATLLSAAVLSISSLAIEAKDTSGIVSEQTLNLPDRHISLEGQSNFRDIGGYMTSDGRSIKWMKVFRSGRLSGLSGADVGRLDELGIKTVVNFLTADEIKADGPGRLPEGVSEIRLSMEAGNMNDLTHIVNEARQTGDFSAVSPEVNPDIHRILITEGRENYAELLKIVSKPENWPIVFHCSHGIHRTGTATAILLSALGVPWKTIREDYLLSNKYRHNEVGPRLEQLKKTYADNRGIPAEEVDTTNMEAFYIIQGEYIDASLEQAIRDYGSMEAYISDGLGISDEEIVKLRSELLE